MSPHAAVRFLVTFEAPKMHRTAAVLNVLCLDLQVKQTVMTSVYGVTYIGARQQMTSRLKDKGWTQEDVIFKASSYGAKVGCWEQSCMPVVCRWLQHGFAMASPMLAAEGAKTHHRLPGMQKPVPLMPSGCFVSADHAGEPDAHVQQREGHHEVAHGLRRRHRR